VSHVYCSECGFQSPAAANYCARCGALLVHDEGGETTMSLTPDDVNDDDGEALEVTVEGTALVVRAGGGIAGQTFTPAGPRTLIGRAPDCDVFLDDVTVSRRHAELLHEGDRFTIRDLGSLNGTFVNRQRVEAAELHDDDEVQVGKYRMTFLQR
jgi:pSer/pThr/pTyr-binding forkhead associated (FHA) protein